MEKALRHTGWCTRSLRHSYGLRSSELPYLMFDLCSPMKNSKKENIYNMSSKVEHIKKGVTYHTATNGPPSFSVDFF